MYACMHTCTRTLTYKQNTCMHAYILVSHACTHTHTHTLSLSLSHALGGDTGGMTFRTVGACELGIAGAGAGGLSC